MRFILFVEGYTEHKALPAFLKRWLDPRLSKSVGIQTVRFEGWAKFVEEAPKKAEMYVSRSDVIAVIGVLDLYGPDFYPVDKPTPDDRYEWAKRHLEEKVGQDKFFQFFAVHELEAWLLSAPSIFPSSVGSQVGKLSRSPERVNNTNPPARRLDLIYKTQLGRRYRKLVDGVDLFRRLDPVVAYDKCPRLKDLLDEMLRLAEGAVP